NASALKDLNQVVTLAPNFAWGYIVRGQALWTNGQPDDAITDFKAAVTRDSSYSVPYFYQVLAFYFQNDFAHAEPLMGQAIERDPNEATYFDIRGYIYVQLNQFDKAMDDFNTALELNPSYADAYAGRGLVYYKQGDNPSALKDLHQYAQLAGVNA